MKIQLSDRTIFKRVLHEARPYWPHIAVLFLLNLVSVPLTLLKPIPVKIAVDSVFGSHPLPRVLEALLPAGVKRTDPWALLIPTGLYVAIALLHQLQAVTMMALRSYTGERMVLRFRAKILLQTQRLSLSYHDAKGSADSVYRLQYDAASIATIALDGVISFITAGLTIAGMVYIVVRLDWKLALIALAMAPLLALAALYFRRRVRRPWHKAKELESSAMAIIQEALGALRVVKVFGREEYERDRFVRESLRGVWVRVRLGVAEGVLNAFIGLVGYAGMAATLLVGGLHVMRGLLSLGDLMMVMIYLMQLFVPLNMIMKKVGELQTSLASAERAFALLDSAPEVVETPDSRPLARAAGRISFQNVSFQYEKDRPVLDDISFDVEPGACVGIAGKTGAGKTTLVNLMARLYEPATGQILIDEVDIRDYRLADLRNQFAFVLQDSVLFSTTIGENIAYARPDASETEIIQAAQAANIHDFVINLPEGYQTKVGERGMTLSGGERQRIALARAFLKDAPILILDEPTSSVDVKTEAAIMEATDRLVQGRTTFIIAHRLSTVKNCDLLLKMDNGRLAGIERQVPEVVT